METPGGPGGSRDVCMEEPGGAEQRWSRAARAFVRETLCPAGPGGGGPEQLADSVMRCLRSTWAGRSGELPLGYSFISISDLQCQQRTPCCSHMTWSTSDFKKWAHQGEVILPKQCVLPRTHLILIGYLTDGRQQKGKEKLMDGNLYVQDSTGSIPCELLHFESEWLELLFLFPSWAYIPQTNQGSAGYVEILADPVPVDPRSERVVDTIPVLYPPTAAQLLSTRVPRQKRAKLNVAGELARLSTLLCIHHKTFFFLFLKCFTSAACVPVLVQKPPQLAWHHMLQLGHGYVLTALTVSSLKASGHKVLVTSFSSCLLPYCAEQVKEQPLEIVWQGGPIQPVSPEAAVHLPLELTDEKLPVPAKESKILSYMGIITRVLNAQAGLYELDNKICLCLAYQQLLNSARGLRPGACVELRDVHLLQKPLASFPFAVVLGACLHSIVLLKGFSRLSTFHQPVASSRNLYMQLLFQYNLGLPLYLWLVSLLEMLEQRFCCFVGRRRLFIRSVPQGPGVAEKFLVPILNAVVPSKARVRDVHHEILAEMHHCPLQQYQPLEPPCQAPPLSLLRSVAEQRSKEAFNPSQLLSPLEAQHMGTQELNRRLAWSYDTFSAKSFQPRMVLLGVLRVSCSSGSLQLRDKSASIPCVISRRDGSPFADTALIGSLLQVETYQLVVERFLQSDFPSWEQLWTLEHVRGRETRLYVQFCFEDVQILHTPEVQVQEGPTSSDSPSLGKKDVRSSKVELGSPEAKLPKLEGTSPGAGSEEGCDRGQSSARETSCMSRLFLVTQKEGLMSRNYLPAAEGDGEGQELQLSFQATILWVDKPQLWGHPREIGNLPELEQINHQREDSEAQQRVLLLFMGRSLRWFPFLHPDGLYRLIVPQCLDFGVFERPCLSPLQGRLLNQSGCSSCLLVSATWHLQHETWISCLAQPQVIPGSERAGMGQTVFSIPELLSSSFTGSLVSFSGEIVERTLCASPGNEKLSAPCSKRRQKGTLLPWDHSVKLSVSAALGSSVVLDVYIAVAYLQHLWGLLPGAKILFQNLQRKISRFHNVYCTYIASSCISILALPPPCLLLSSNPAGIASKSPAATSPSLVFLSKLLLQPHSLSQGQILCHLSCVLALSLQWICSVCSSIFREGRCSRHSPPCPSQTGVSQASAKILVEDGTGEALVLCKNQQVAAVLGLSPVEWKAVQSNVQRRGSIFIQHGGASARPGCVEEPEDLVTCYLKSLCRSHAICRPILLAFSLNRKSSKISQPDSLQLRRFLCGEMEFVSRVGTRLSLTCLNIQEADPKVLCSLSSKRIKTSIGHSA
ncbi:CST complex subunit CTC1 isoform X1 [Trachemys scripta elegans]|uniref:CST complex subunit CTC1 isoform X1 n=1 Tax=Trachemys scripta elegans TaxID=31138 RepID=UPI001555F423|nr:CST complex subunit CTC1 isoform X1 [Trachemys scripta elegans]